MTIVHHTSTTGVYTAYLHNMYQVGTCVMLNGRYYQIIKSGKSCDCLPGGQGIREVHLRHISYDEYLNITTGKL